MDAILLAFGEVSDSLWNRAAKGLSHRGPKQNQIQINQIRAVVFGPDAFGHSIEADQDSLIVLAGRPDWQECSGTSSINKLQSWGKSALKAIKDGGTGQLASIPGDWALFYFDPILGPLVAVDPMGRCVLHTRRIGKTWFVCSEAQVLHKLDPKPVSNIGLTHWMVNRYDLNFVCFPGVMGLEPSQMHSLRENTKPQLYTKPWLPPLADPSPEAEKQVVDVLNRSIGNRIGPHHRRIGSHLSGGMDSSSIAALTSRIAKKTFGLSYGFKRFSDCDETLFSRAVAKHCGMEHVVMETHDMPLYSPYDGLPIETPFFGWELVDSNLIKLCKSQGGELLFTGHFGDNLFHGLRILSGLADGVWRGSVKDCRAFLNLANDSTIRNRHLIYREMISPRVPAWIKTMYRRLKGVTPFRPPFLPEKAYQEAQLAEIFRAEPINFSSLFQAATRNLMYQQTFGIRRAIHYLDRLGGSLGVRIEHPFFDRRVRNLVATLPFRTMFPNLFSKELLRRAMNSYLPKIVLDREDKPTLTAIYHEGLQKNLDYFVPKRFILEERGLLRAEPLMQALNRYLKKPHNSPNQFFSSLQAERFLRVWS